MGNGRKKYIICGKFFDGVHEELLENYGIVVEEDLIQAVGAKLPVPQDAEVIDLSHLTVTPGLIDSHEHFDFAGTETLPTYSIHDSDEMKALNVVYNAIKSLQGGFTTVRHFGCGSNGFGSVDAKRAIDKGMFDASRLFVAPHALGITGGHLDPSQYMRTNPFLSEYLEAHCAGTGNGVDACKRMVRKQVKYGADFIKILATGGFGAPIDNPETHAFDNDELTAIIDTAHGLERYVTAHAYTPEQIQNLVHLGADEITHGSMLDAQTADLMEEKGVTLLCTMTPFEDALQGNTEIMDKMSSYFRKNLERYEAQLRKARTLTVELITSRRVLVGMGADIMNVYQNYEGWYEFKHWRENGIPALRCLVAATSDNAKIIHCEDLGELNVGKFADIAAWSSDILNDPSALSVCDFVMKEGKIVKHLQ